MDPPCSQTAVQFPCYYPPAVPTWWIPPPADNSSPSDKVPTWVIVGLVVAGLILFAFIFLLLKKRIAKKEEVKVKAAVVASEPAKPVEEPKKAVAPPPPSVKKGTATASANEVVSQPYHHPHTGLHAFADLVQAPGDCTSCGRKAGLYQLSYKCPKCTYKYDVGIHIQYPGKH